ncbi:probable peptide/nitrate transporter At3g43790 [Dendronephthya gigantea]|uniref:probable peptide/nitrate transporter At3g43790 n=1 Tax=Dendronephthya gigantea TaxID=151771 RepID=UPI00106B3464|nr:probable peptide/nitrate transporter At3g43790 [Dendronephthya gigantea]
MSCGIIQYLSEKLLSAVQPKGSTPLPGGIIGALFVSMFGNAVAMQLLFAFLPDMVKSFGIADEDAGYYVGLLASAVFLGRFISSYFWGWLADKVGRRTVLLWCNGLLAVTTLAFGFSKSFEVALVIRFTTGVIAGIAGTVKASLADVCDDTNQAIGMSVIVTAWNTGLIIGPAIGGYLARPADKYSVFKKSSFFKTFAYLLPCILNAVLPVFSFFLVFFSLPETLVSKRIIKPKETQLVSKVLDDQKPVSLSPSSRKRTIMKHSQTDLVPHNTQSNLNQDVSHQQSTSKSIETQLLTGSVSFLPDLHLQSYPWPLDNTKKVEEPYDPPSEKSKPGIIKRSYEAVKRSTLSKLIKNKNVRYSVGLYTTFSFAVVAEHEMYSLWAATGKEFGGLDFDTNDLGFTLMVVGIGCAISNCIVFPQMVKMFGLMKTQFISLILSMFFTIILPIPNIFYGRPVVVKTMVIILLLLVRVNEGCCFTGQFIMIGNSVSSSFRATVHGFAMTVVCSARAISPSVAGSMFSWSISSGLGFPFNEKFVFIFLGFVLWLALIVACCMDEEAVTKPSTE